ncbi:MAG: SPOR domain-containing protein [Candidatus Latescibacterota bacterium]
MRNAIPLIALMAAMAGCAGRPGLDPPPPTGAAVGGTTAEEFDPESLQEDLPPIQATFPAPPPDRLPAAPAATVEAQAPAPRSGRPPGPGPGPTPAGSRLYRVQIMALSNAEAAAEWQSRLESELGVPVLVDHERGRHLVRAGAFAREAEARRFVEELAASHPEYADAYVVSVVPQRADVDSTGVAVAGDSLLQPPAPNLVPMFGWRILLDQFLSHEQAEQFRARAVERLGRSDIDITFKAPWYKVELGNFRAEGHAQDAFQNLKPRYPNALLVRSQILVPAEE